MKNIASLARYTLQNAHRRFLQGIGLLASPQLCIFGLLTAHKRRTQVGGRRSINAIIFAAGLLPTAYAQTPVTNAAKVAAGASGTCLLTNVGGVKCWGDGAAGALGNNTDITVKTPVDVLGLTMGVRDIAAGSQFACAVTNAGAAKCWGRGSFGRLGDGASTDRSAPVDVATLSSGVTAIGAGSRHTCAITSSGGVKCWGSNNVGQLGDNSNTLRAAPVEVLSGPTLAPLSGITAIAVGNSHTCALTSGGGVKCWGFNGYGQLGDGSYIGRLTPGDVPTLTSGVSAIAAGDNHTCALISGGGVKCWGAGSSGQLGDNLNTDRNTPQQVLSGQSSSALGGITAISAAGSHTCTVTTGSGIKCWGANAYGQLGDNSTSTRSTPVDVRAGPFLPALTGAVAVALGSYHSCALMSGGRVSCWGYNTSGELGDDTYTNRSTPVSTVVYADPALYVSTGNFGGGPGTVTASDGNNCPGACTVTHAPNDVVLLTAKPNVGARFENWSGACAASGETCSIIIDSTKYARANFRAPLTINKTGTGLGLISGPFAFCPSTSTSCKTDFSSSFTIELTARADTGSTFTGWSGDCSGTGTCTVTMSNARSVTANFTNPTPLLTVDIQPFAPGIVTGTGGMNCPVTCSVTYAANTIVTLTATPNTGASFDGWTGACTGMTTTCTVTMEAAKRVAATFYATLTLSKIGTGNVAISAGVPIPSTIVSGDSAYFYGETLTLVATAEAGSTFTGWSGACTGTRTCIVTMSTARSVTANFTKPTPKLNVTIVGSGIASGSVIGTGGVSCPGICSVFYEPNTVVTLTATPNANAIFSGWSESCGGSAPTCTVTMDVSKSVAALFSLPTLTLSKKGVGSGSISGDVTCASASPCGTYMLSPRQSVTLTASPDRGSTFAGWSGTCSGTGACTLTMNVPQFAQATFLFNGVSDAFPLGGNLPDGWVHPVGSTASWVVASDATYEGSLSLKSGLIKDSQKSEISYTGRFSATNVSFARKVSSEANSDFLEFYIDGVLQDRWSGEVGWSQVSYPVMEGTHTLLWRYVKDGSASSGSDAAWIDNVSFLPGTSLGAILYLLFD